MNGEMVKRLVALFLLAIFSLQTIGVTVMHHVCSSHHRDGITSINGISAETASGCCCSENKDGCDPYSPHPERLSIVMENCCQEQSSYLKFQFTAGTTGTLMLIPVFAALLSQIFNPAHQEDTSTGINAHPYFRYYSPPLTGVGFLLSIHQIKIPQEIHC